MKRLIIYTDGGARGNPGPAGIGVVIKNSESEVIEEFKEYIGETTNNQAEYQAVVKGLELALKLKAEEAEFYLDSELVVNQINGKFKLKNPDFQQWFIKIHNFKQQFKKIIFTHIPREQNSLADQLANEAMDDKLA